MASTSNGAKVQFKPRKLAQERRAEVPEGKWEFLIPKGGCKVVTSTAATKSVTGKCSKDSPSRGCKQCETNPPSEACGYHLEKK